MIKKLWDKVVNREVITYLIFGVLTTFVNWIIYFTMVRSHYDYRIANAAAWAGSVLFAYITNKLIVFQSHNMGPEQMFKEFVSFVSCRVLSGVMEMVFIIVMVSWLHMGENISKILVSVLVVIANYVFSKLFVFKKN